MWYFAKCVNTRLWSNYYSLGGYTGAWKTFVRYVRCCCRPGWSMQTGTALSQAIYFAGPTFELLIILFRFFLIITNRGTGFAHSGCILVGIGSYSFRKTSELVIKIIFDTIWSNRWDAHYHTKHTKYPSLAIPSIVRVRISENLCFYLST